MKNKNSQIIGLEENGDSHTVEELLSALSGEHYQRLVGFARLRLRAVGKPLGFYNPHLDQTFTTSGQMVGHGNLLASLLR